MGCLLFFNFLLSVAATTLLIVSITTSKWLVFVDGANSSNQSERSIGILYYCQRLYSSTTTDQFSTVNNLTNTSVSYDAFVCYNRLLKWVNPSTSGPDLFDYQKALIGISFGSAFLSIIALLFTQLLKTQSSFHNLGCSKRIIEFLLMANVLTVILSLITLALFLGFERLQTITTYGFSFWLYIVGTCCAFLNCILTAVYRIDVEFEFRRYRHESIATLC